MYRETTVIVPTFNQAKYLDRCLRSLLHQRNYADYEVVCVNDGSDDETSLILKQYKNEITILENSENRGLPFSVNRGILESKSQFLVRVDSDDYVSENFLHLLTLTLKSSQNLDAIACDYELVGESIAGKVVNCIEEPIACGILFRRDNLFDVGLYDEQFRIHEDKELMGRFLQNYEITRLPIPLYRYRMHDKNLTKSMLESEFYMKRLMKKRNITE